MKRKHCRLLPVLLSLVTLLSTFCLPLGAADGDTEKPADSTVGQDVLSENGVNAGHRDNIILNAYLVPLQTEELRRSMFALCRDAEIDVLSHVYLAPEWIATDHNYENYKPVMEEAAEYGLALLSRDYRAQTSLDRPDEEILRMAKEYKDLPGFAGFFVQDEPYYPNGYARVENLIRSVIPGALVNVNFLPRGSYPDGVYIKQLTDYGALIDPDGTLSMDCYCFPPSGGVNEYALFTNYEDVRQAGLRTSQNTAVYVQSVEMYGGYRTPSEADLRYNIMAALAYGVKEIKFFTWGTSPSSEYNDAIIGRDYQPTARYEYACRINKKVHKIGTYLAACDALRVYHTAIDTAGCYEILPKDSFISFSGRADFIVSMMEEREGTGEYVMIVNKNLKTDRPAAFSFKGEGDLQLVDDATGELKPLAKNADGTYTLNLAAGDSALIKLPAGDYVAREIVETDNLAQNAVWKSTSSTTDNDYYVYHLFDGSETTGARFFAGDHGSMDQSVTLDFGGKTAVNRVELSPLGRGEHLGDYFPKTVTVYGSDDGLTWRALASGSEQSLFADRSVTPEMTFDKTEVRYLRVTFGGFAHKGQMCELSGLGVYCDESPVKAPATAYTKPTLREGGDLASGKPVFDCSSGASSASALTSSGTGKWVTDDVFEYQSSEAYVTVDLLDVYALNKVVLTAGDAGVFPEDMEILLSADGTHYTQAVRKEAVTVRKGERLTLTFDETPARYVRLYVTRLHEGADRVEVQQMSVYGGLFSGAALPPETEAPETRPVEPETTVEPATDAADVSATDESAADESAADESAADESGETQTEAEPDTAASGTDAATGADTEPVPGGCASALDGSFAVLLALSAALALCVGIRRKTGGNVRAASALAVCLAAALALTSLAACTPGTGDAGMETDTETATPTDEPDTAPAAPATDTESDTQPNDEPATEAETDAPAPAEDGYIRDSEANVALTPRDGLLASLGFSAQGTAGDSLKNATLHANGRIGSMSVRHDGKDCTVPAFAADENEAAALDLTRFGTDYIGRLTDGCAISASVMFTQDVGQANRAIFSGTQNGLLGLWVEKGHFKLVVWADGPVEVCDTAAVVPGELYCLTGVYDAQAGTATLYVNGKSAASAQVGTMTAGQADGLFVLGADADGSGAFGSYGCFPAVYTFASVYDNALTADEVKAAYDAFASGLASPDASAGKPVYNPADEFSIDELKVTGTIKKDAVLIVTGVLGSTSDNGCKAVLTMTCPDGVSVCKQNRQELPIAADGYAHFAFEVTVTTDHPGKLPLTVSVLTGSGTVVTQETVVSMERSISLDKESYMVGEPVYVTASGGPNDWIGFYRKGYVPGTDATIYNAHFDGYSNPAQVIPVNQPVNLKDFPGDNRGNPQCDPYLNLPAGDYKIILFADGGYTVVQEIAFHIAKEGEEEPGGKWEGKDVSGEEGPYLYTDKTIYQAGDTIWVQAGGTAEDWIAFYPEHYVPGHDASIYYTHFAPCPGKPVIESGVVVSLEDFEGNNWGNPQANPYRNLPAGKYKLILLAPGYKQLARIDIEITN